MKAISKKSMKQPRMKIRMLTTIRKPIAPPGMSSNRCSTQMWPSAALKVKLKTVEPTRMKSTKHDSLAVLSSAWISSDMLSLPRPTGHQQRAQRAHRAAFGGRGDAQEDGAQHQEDQHQRRDQHEGDLLGQARQQADLEELVHQRQRQGQQRGHRHRQDEDLVAGRRQFAVDQRVDHALVHLRPGVAGDAADQRTASAASGGRWRRWARGRCALRPAAPAPTWA